MNANAPTFQDALARLERYWNEQGCLVWMPHNVEVGAGTMNPATFLRVLGPEPWNVAYVEPSIRPDDARYGENPNRVGRHHQLQVILKPDPGNPQELYLASLATLGIDLTRHDVRFVEDNWESPALGAWGLGWEVWLDGLEITQFTYFQQAGSLELEPVSVELTYGLDRILMALQGVGHFTELRWSSEVTLGDMLYDYEVETSRYYFEAADIPRLRELFGVYEAEAEATLDAGLVTVSHDYVLKCSHVFNVLDARGAVGVTERAQLFGRMRRLSARIAEG
jgi:glycyl-tRNA synthetase